MDAPGGICVDDGGCFLTNLALEGEAVLHLIGDGSIGGELREVGRLLGNGCAVADWNTACGGFIGGIGGAFFGGVGAVPGAAAGAAAGSYVGGLILGVLGLKSLAEGIAQAIPAARYVELDASHISNIEKADAFTKAVIDFLTEPK